MLLSGPKLWRMLTWIDFDKWLPDPKGMVYIHLCPKRLLYIPLSSWRHRADPQAHKDHRSGDITDVNLLYIPLVPWRHRADPRHRLQLTSLYDNMYPKNYNTSITTHIQHFLYLRSIISSEIIYSSKVKRLALVISNTTKYQLSSNHHSPCLQTQAAKTRGALLHLLRLHLSTLTHCHIDRWLQ